ncbi:signal recognition particle protein Srp19 [Methanobrevibacter woesei]|uniref:Signal recognition particle 19 kDa protein n=1 Tax=Methanobrevibacter woesei TaxID=190976 RepID=A0A2U1S9J0_9EURY|nr:signal recognition particle subunit SRP19/SEC65 family protein [Methanobrevibacter woesei]MCC9261047.1 signal recognition particle protein Srp19 [Methanobrevibacter woesei]MCI7290635.1 signal recognition particle protein Srp19 [Methanobrevibacter woesei]PWB87093.1 signal recognition particle protein Srp19 [Methanobrevibacter woesei]
MNKQKNRIIIWPQYFDKNLSHSEGRKVSLEYAINEPTVNDISRALKRLQIPNIIHNEKAYPGKWYEKSGCILAESDQNKLQLLKEIGLKLKEIK